MNNLSSAIESLSLSPSVSPVTFLKVSNNLNCLPIELYHAYLFKLMDLDDVVKLMFVSRRLYSVVTSYDCYVNELSILDAWEMDKDKKNNWFSTTKPIELNRISSKIGLLNNPSMKFTNLKYLNLMIFKDEKFDLNVLNQFTKLQVLILSRGDNRQIFKLCLPNLKAFSIDFIRGIVIDAPTLQILNVDNQNEFRSLAFLKMLHFQSIRYLQLYDFEFCHTKCLKFENLECLELYGLRYEIPCLFELSDNKNLKKLKLTNLKKRREYVHDKNALETLLENRHLFKNGLEIVVDGVRIEKIEQFDEYKEISLLDFQLKNYGSLEDDLNFMDVMFYKKLNSQLPADLPSDFFNKYTNIQKLLIYSFEGDDQNQLIKFMRRCPNLCALVTSNLSVGQEFYDQLPTFSLISLDINTKKVKLNFEFIMKMSYLRSLLTDQDIQLNEEMNLNNLRFLRKLSFYINDKWLFAIAKKCKDKYSVKNLNLPNQPDKKNLSLEEVIDWSNDLREI